MTNKKTCYDELFNDVSSSFFEKEIQEINLLLILKKYIEYLKKWLISRKKV